MKSTTLTLLAYALPSLFYPNGIQTFRRAEVNQSVSSYTTNLPAMAGSINAIPGFSCFGLSLTPSDHLFVRAFGELIEVIAWGLRNTQ